MALDIGELQATITVNTQALQAAAPAFNRLETAINNLSKIIESFASKAEGSFSRVATVATTSAKKVAQDKGYIEFFGQASKSAEDSAKVFETSFKMQEQAQKQAIQANKQAIKEEEAAIKARTASHKEAWAQIVRNEKVARDSSTKLEDQAFVHGNKVAKEKISLEERAFVHQNKLVRQQISESTKLQETYAKQANSVFLIEQQVTRLAASYKRLEGGNRYVASLTNALNTFKSVTNGGKVTSEQFTKAQMDLRRNIEATKTSVAKAHPELDKFRIGMSEAAKTAVIALGPLNGVASRITAIASIANASALPIAAAFAGIAAFAVAAGKSVVAGAKMESQLLKMTNALKAFGNQTGMTVQQLDAIAIELAKATLASTEFAREAVTALLAFNGVGGSTRKVLFLAQDLTDTFGGSLLENTRKLGQVMEDPIRALENLGEAGVRFSAQQKEVIESFVLTGKSAQASQYVLDAVYERVGSAGKEAAKGLAGSWDTLGESFTRFVESAGGMETRGGTLANTITNIATQFEHFSRAGGEAERFGKSVGAVLQALADITLFAARNFEYLVMVYTGFIAGGLAYKVAKAWLASAAAAELVAIQSGKAAVGIAAMSKALRVGLMLTGVGAIAVISGLIANYFLFSESAEKAAKSQEKINNAISNAKESAPLTREQELTKLLAATSDQVTELSREYARLSEARSEALKLGNTSAVKQLDNSLESLTIRVYGLTGAYGKLQAELDKLLYDASLKGTKDSLTLYEQLRGNILQSTKAQTDFNKALMIAESINISNALTVYKDAYTDIPDGANKAREAVQGLLDFRAATLLLKDTGGFPEISNSIRGMNRDLAKSNALIQVALQNGAYSSKQLEDAFEIEAAIQKQREKLNKADIKELQRNAAELGLTLEKYTGNSKRDMEIRKSNIEKIAVALGTEEQQIKRNTQALRDFISFSEKKAELDRQFSRSNAVLVETMRNGTNAGRALQQAFDKETLIHNQWIELLKLNDESVILRAQYLGISTEGKDVYQVIDEIAKRIGEQTYRTDLNNKSTERYNELLAETKGLMDRITVAKVGGTGFEGFINNLFNPEGVKRAKEFESDFIQIRDNLLSATSQEGGEWTLIDNIEQYRKVAQEAGMEDPFKNIDPSNTDSVAKGIAKVNQHVKDLEDSSIKIIDIFSEMWNKFSSLMSQIQQMYEAQAQYHAQMASEALNNGRSQAQLYMQLADAVHYSNNAQAQSFEQRAIAEATAANKRFEQEEKLRAKANREAKKAFDNNKKMQIAEATMATAVASIRAASALAFAPPLAAAAAAAMTALGLAQVQLIQKQEYTPRATGGSFYGNKPYMVGEEGPEVIVPGRSGTVLSQEAIMEGMSGGGGGDVTIVFNIQAHDASGFDRLLASRRGMIINMIRQGTDSRMRTSPV